MKRTSLGKHILVDFHGCDIKIIDDLEKLKILFLAAAKIAKATIITDVFHKFSPQGVSGVVVIGESHLAIHTWPEYGIASVDLFTCSDEMLTSDAITFLQAHLKATHSKIQEISRGQIQV